MKDLRQLRQEKGLTVMQLQEKAHVGKAFVSRIENGVVDVDNITIGNALRVAMVLGISLDEFYDAAKATKPTGKIGSPLMVTGQPRKIGGNRWKNREKKSD